MNLKNLKTKEKELVVIIECVGLDASSSLYLFRELLRTRVILAASLVHIWLIITL